MTDCFTMDKERERHLARLTQQVILLVVESIMLLKNYFSRKNLSVFYLFYKDVHVRFLDDFVESIKIVLLFTL